MKLLTIVLFPLSVPMHQKYPEQISNKSTNWSCWLQFCWIWY